MRISTPSSLWLRPGVAKRKKSAQKYARKKGKAKFTKENRLLILINRITRA